MCLIIIYVRYENYFIQKLKKIELCDIIISNYFNDKFYNLFNSILMELVLISYYYKIFKKWLINYKCDFL